MYIDVSQEADEWLGRVNHDLVKRLLWPARDRRALGGPVQAGELVVMLADADGNPQTAEETWRQLRAEAPPVDPEVLVAFDRAVESVQRAAAGGDLAGVMALGPAFETLARKVKWATAAPPLPGASNPQR
jgi:hypothetical protein